MNQGYQAEKALGYQQITNVAAAVGFTIPAETSMAVVTVGVQAVRWRDDGTNPTATVGMPVAAGSTVTFTSSQLARVRFIEQAAGAVLNISYYS